MLSHYPRYRAVAAQGLAHKLGGLPWGLPSRAGRCARNAAGQ